MKPQKNRSVERLETRNLLAADVGTSLTPDLVSEELETVAVSAEISTTQAESLANLTSSETIAAIPTTTTTEVRSIDGTGNNLENPELGSAGTQLLRTAESDYADGISELAGEDRPSAREVSNVIAAQDPEATGNERELSAFVYVWGQFLDHDIDLTESSGTESANIEIPTGDAYFDPDGTGEQVMNFTRSVFDVTTGDSVDNPREQINEITAFVDGSQVYGSSQEVADSLRTFEGGKLLTSEGDLLPVDENGSFLAGDIRANENIELTSLQTLFVREHNRLAEEIAAQNADLTDEEIYQQARVIVIAEIQSITYNEFLPALLGEESLSEYEGYDPTVDPSIANEFSTAAYRLGHSLLNDDVEFFGDDGRAVFDEVALSEAFFNPDLLKETGIDSLLKYSASSQSQEIDTQVVDSIRNFLFLGPGQGGFDLASLNIQRGRDHGLADYNSTREAYGLERVESFADITSDVELQANLASLYDSVDDIDLWVGVLAEDPVAGSSLGELNQTIIVDQFTRLRDGDRFWYENYFSEEDVQQIEESSLSDIIQRNSSVTNLQDNVFFMSATVSGTVVEESSANGKHDRGGTQGAAGVTVELLNDEGEVVDTTTTDSSGFYAFDTFRETGDYQVSVLRSTADGTVAETADVLISVGGQVVSDVNFGTVVEDRHDRDNSHDRKDHRDDRDQRHRSNHSRFAAVDEAFGRGTHNDHWDSIAKQLASNRSQRGRR
ncbi:peroxidase family protein [Adhaeretor mobilis]|uniref:Peroxidase n=1 Tax=Adhaeretor mobilis TaxID=1930276 RepID=A0A517MXN0_9BACT|nr:peroxidase family protein [Adhaeretor mobilis]QDS99636.1 peroxidase [Adhaeretor mobilis]